ncbi:MULTISPECIES: Ger(x)C family spore germination protein [unclassified Oceanobacillus]|uniref:Ger(x)C family spore germination protein n=1 Tax=unclassified Oceanobacillus TaxID=2630292 RepID=UPI001BE7891B|nr:MULTISPECIES: Ger(x)C family spore germination protein [unclassified Oceanobacillus]MBT2600623.1 Ger(x)C family spore germination protein [Oceanobacillus sp. ISL-74]MBT2650980.1 Ger(x)C family spore germination protein [Oceanobacillus sp. ISL-73]
MKKLLVSIIITSFLFLTGCWDSLELEERAFLSGIAIDLPLDNTNQTLNVTEQIVVPNGLITLPASSGTGKGFRNIVEEGRTIYEVGDAIEKQEDRKLDGSHIEIVVISDEVVKEEYQLADVVDVFMREKRMNREVILSIAEGSAGELLYIEPQDVKLPSQYLTQLIIGNYRSVGGDPQRFGNMQQYFINNRSFTLPLLTTEGSSTGIDLTGLAVFSGDNSKMIGALKDDNLEGYMIIQPMYNGSVTTKLDNTYATFHIPDGKTKIKLKNKDPENLHFEFETFLDAELVETFYSEDFFAHKNMKKLESSLETRVKSLITGTIEKVRDEYETDILGLAEHLITKEPKIWKQVKDDWDYGENYFKDVEITLSVNIDIREPGNSVDTD